MTPRRPEARTDAHCGSWRPLLRADPVINRPRIVCTRPHHPGDPLHYNAARTWWWLTDDYTPRPADDEPIPQNVVPTRDNNLRITDNHTARGNHTMPDQPEYPPPIHQGRDAVVNDMLDTLARVASFGLHPTKEPDLRAYVRMCRDYLDTPTAAVLDEVRQERLRQDEKWGQQNHPDGTGGDHYTQLADLAKRSTDTAADHGTLTWRRVLAEEYYEALAETDPAKLRTELIQIAAVATAWAEAIDRRSADL